MEMEPDSIQTLAKELFEINHRTGGINGRSYDYTCPSPEGYPHQWLWDSSFHAIVLSRIDPERAKREIDTLLLKQRDDGFIPCVKIWDKRFPFEEFFYVDKITQPPVIPIAVETIFERTKDGKFIKKVYPKLKAFMDWLAANRDRNANHLIEIIDPWEDGDDGNPSFDKQMGFSANPSTIEYFYKIYKVLGKYALNGWDEDKIYKSKTFRAETALFNSIYAKSLLSMIGLAKVSGRESDVAQLQKRYDQVRSALINLSWNEKDKIFYDLDQNGKQSRIKTTSSLMPLILPDLPEKIYKPLVEEHLLNEKEFWAPYPITSVSQDEKTFNPGKTFDLWRGPMWVNTNWFLYNALNHYGYKTEAYDLASRTAEAIRKYGFREFYNPFTGEGYGQPNFGWSTLVLEMASV